MLKFKRNTTVTLKHIDRFFHSTSSPAFERASFERTRQMDVARRETNEET